MRDHLRNRHNLYGQDYQKGRTEVSEKFCNPTKCVSTCSSAADKTAQLHTDAVVFQSSLTNHSPAVYNTL